MPKIQYRVRIEGDSFIEWDYFQSVDNPTAIVQEVIDGWNLYRQKYQEPLVELIEVSITDPYTHQHEWTKYSLDKFALKAHYRCSRCFITSFRRLHLAHGEYGGLTRDEQYQQRKYELCRDPLKKLPALKFQ